MFRRTGKNPLEKDHSTSPLYKEDAHHVTAYKYAMKKSESEIPRLFESPHAHAIGSIEENSRHEEYWRNEKTTPLPHHFQGVMKEEEPETTLGEGVTFRGELSFEKLLRIDGTFEGKLLSQGKVIVGAKGNVKANLNLREAVVEGHIEGNITVQERLELRGEASVIGDIQAKWLSVDEGVSICGTVHVTANEDKK